MEARHFRSLAGPAGPNPWVNGVERRRGVGIVMRGTTEADLLAFPAPAALEEGCFKRGVGSHGVLVVGAHPS